MKKVILLVVIVIALALTLFVWKPFSRRRAESGKAISISTAVVKRGELVISVSAAGVVEPLLTVDLKSKASGEVVEIPIEEGDHVEVGQLICRLDTLTAQNDYDQSVADLSVTMVALDQATRQAERQSQLFKQGLISELDYDSAVLAREQANSNLIKARTAKDNAGERLDETVIRSPIDGIVLKKYVEKGQIIASGISAVSGGTTIATVADMSNAYVQASVDQVDIGQVGVGQKATIVAESYPDREFPGVVTQIHPLAVVQQNVTTFEVTTKVDNSEGFLMAGMDVNVEIIAAQKENILLVPREALTDVRSIARMIGGPSGGRGQFASTRQGEQGQGGQSHGPGGAVNDLGGSRGSGGPPGTGNGSGKQADNPTRVVIVISDGKQEPRRVEIGLSNFEQAEVLSGLSEGDTVLTTVTSEALKDRQEFLERMRGWSQLPGMGGRGR